MSPLKKQLISLGISLPEGTDRELLWFLEELFRWNRKVNLTAVTDWAAALEKHLVDSLTVLPLLGEKEEILDLGSGGGFPGLPLKIARKALPVWSVDSIGKKIAFQRHVARTLGLEGFAPIQARAEELITHMGQERKFSLIVSRAFTSLSRFATLALPLLAPGGRILAMKGGEGEREAKDSAGELESMGLTCTELIRLRLPESGAERSLIVLRRVE